MKFILNGVLNTLEEITNKLNVVMASIFNGFKCNIFLPNNDKTQIMSIGAVNKINSERRMTTIDETLFKFIRHTIA